MSACTFTNCLIGGALGDSLGLPCENLSARRIQKLWKGEWKQRLYFGRGMFSDDTEHAAMTAQALAAHRDDPEGFTNALGRSIRWWFAAIPAGIGLATAKSCMRLWIGISPTRSGVNSAGNGAAMRAAIIGAFYADDAEGRCAFVEASTRITHRDPRALDAALWTAEAAACACHGIESTDEILARLEALISTPIFRERLEMIRTFLAKASGVNEFADSFGRSGRVSGYAPDSVAVAIYAWLRYRRDFAKGLTEVLSCGGDTDTVGAIFGGIAGCETDDAGFPREWVDRMVDWPLTTMKLRALGEALAEQKRPVPKLASWPVALIRNAAFLGIILAHVVRRVLPPY